MDSRLHERLPLSLKAQIINLTRDEDPVDGELTDISASGVCVRAASRLTPGDVVRVDFSDGSLFGQIVYANPESPTLRCGVEVFEVLLGSSDLSRLIEQTLKSRGPVPEDPESIAPPVRGCRREGSEAG